MAEALRVLDTVAARSSITFEYNHQLVGGAAIDVFEREPLPASPHFEGCPNLLLTPHVAGVTVEANERVSFLIADKVLEALA